MSTPLKNHNESVFPVAVYPYLSQYLKVFLLLIFYQYRKSIKILIIFNLTISVPSARLIDPKCFFLIMNKGNTQIPDSSGFELDRTRLYSEYIWINYAIQSEASIVLLIIFFSRILLRKRCSAIFLCHILLLILSVARNILQCYRFFEIYHHLGPDRPRAYARKCTLWITTDLLAFLILLCIEISLFLHAYAACVALHTRYRQILSGIAASVTVLATGLRLAFYVEVPKDAAPLITSMSFDWLLRTSNLMTSIIICGLCAVVCVKLGSSLRFRSKHGLGRFGPTHIIVIMCCQTSTILGLSRDSSMLSMKTDGNFLVTFSILQYFVQSSAIATDILGSVAIFLPLSSLWILAFSSNRLESFKLQNRVTIPYLMAGSKKHSRDFHLERWPGMPYMRRYSHDIVRSKSPFDLSQAQNPSKRIKSYGSD